MGLEAVCICHVDEFRAEAKVLLEARDLILRAPFRMTIKLAEVTETQTAGDQLRLRVGSSVIDLDLGRECAAKWAKRIMTPPPNLAQKLGIDQTSSAFVIGNVDDSILAEALEGHAADPSMAKFSLAIVRDDQQLLHAVGRHESAMAKAPIWIVHGKGPSASFGEAPVRQHMRARGYRDTKVAAVSAELTATRYSLR